MDGRIKIIYGSVAPGELLQYTKDYDIIIDMRPSSSEPLEKILDKAKCGGTNDGPSKAKPRFKMNVW